MSLKIAITGSSGMVGTALGEHWQRRGGVEVLPVIRDNSDAAGTQGIRWNIGQQTMDAAALEGVDVVINLAGANIAGHRWTDDYKRLIRDSRVKATKLLSSTLAQLNKPPKLLLSASAVGYYGTHPATETLDEYSMIGHDFLADVCRDWEAATGAAEMAAIRVVHMRFGTILSRKGGALAKMLTPFRLGLGGPIGDGRQMFSWILLDEIPLVVDFLIREKSIAGPVNVVAPHAVTNREFTSRLGEALRRPTVLPMPAAAVKLLFGEMGETLLLTGQKVQPKRLQENGYEFEYAALNDALRRAIGN